MKVYQAINAVQSDLAKNGIQKDRKNAMQGYNFRGIDDMYNALAPLLSKHGLCILPRTLSRECVERQSNKGGALFYITVEMEFDFVASEDGSKHTVKMYGEAMDSGDKATNKAMSAAYKYACMQAFSIPTEGDNDADAHTHEVKHEATSKANPSPAITGVRKTQLTKTAQEMIDLMRNNDDWGVYGLYKEVKNNDEKLFIWPMIPSDCRSAIGRCKEAEAELEARGEKLNKSEKVAA